MGQLTRRLVNFLDRHDGPTAVEYAIMLSVVVMLCVFGVRTFESKPAPGKAAKTISAAR
jgi:pilus assembly protein Flp/PilA